MWKFPQTSPGEICIPSNVKWCTRGWARDPLCTFAARVRVGKKVVAVACTHRFCWQPAPRLFTPAAAPTYSHNPYILINPGMQYETTPRFRPLTSYPSRGTLTALTPDRQWTLRRADHRTLSTSDAACALSDAPRVHEALKVNSEIDPLSTATFGSTHALQEFPLTDAISDISITIRNFAIHYNL